MTWEAHHSPRAKSPMTWEAYHSPRAKPEDVFSCDQAALWIVQSVCPSVCLSVCLSVTPFWLCSHHRIIMKISRVFTYDRIDVHAKGQGQRSKVKVTEVKTQYSHFRTVTPVWIHIWWWNDAQSLMMLRRGALLFFKVIRQISRSHGLKKIEFTDGFGMMRKAWYSIKGVIHQNLEIDDLNPIWVSLLGRSQLSDPSDLPCCFCFGESSSLKYDHTEMYK